MYKQNYEINIHAGGEVFEFTGDAAATAYNQILAKRDVDVIFENADGAEHGFTPYHAIEYVEVTESRTKSSLTDVNLSDCVGGGK